MDQVASQSDLQCSACAGQCRFDPATGQLTCDSCATHHDITVDQHIDPTAEFHYSPDTKHTESKTITRTPSHTCETCGGELVFTGASLSERCPYCDGPVVLNAQEASYQTLGLIPFRISGPEAAALTRTWAQRRWAAPSDLAKTAEKESVIGLYVPFFTFDSDELVNYSLTYRYRSGKKTRRRTIKGSMRTAFDDLLIPASPHITPLIRDGILHEFRPSDLLPYDPAFLAGFAAERHHLSVSEGLNMNEADKDLLLRNRIKKHAGKTNVVNISYKTHTSGIRYRRILLPVWILHYRYKEKPYKIVACGIHGRTFGERPFSIPKLLGLSAGLTAAVLAFGWLWGAAQIY